jgi:hypothetical protein
MSRRKEDQLQRSVLDHLRWRAVDGAFWFHVPNGGWRSPVEAMVFKSLGVTAGVPDLLIVHDGGLFGLELKAEGGRVSEAQHATMEAMRRAGAIVAVAHGIDQALAQLEAWNLLRRLGGKARGAHRRTRNRHRN